MRAIILFLLGDLCGSEEWIFREFECFCKSIVIDTKMAKKIVQTEGWGRVNGLLFRAVYYFP